MLSSRGLIGNSRRSPFFPTSEAIPRSNRKRTAQAARSTPYRARDSGQAPDPRRKQRAGTLSGGGQKMLLAARALMARPRLMLIDEISEGLQPSIISRLSNALGAERERGNVAMALVEQNLSFALSIQSRAVREPTWTPIRISRRTRLPHTTIHMFGPLKRHSLCFLLLIPAAVAQGPWRVIYTKAKREISHVRNMVRLLLRWIAETESTSKNGITERLHRRVEGRT